MFTIKRKLFSRHTPKDLEDYRKISDDEIKNMTRGQRLRYLEEEDEKAGRNVEKYVSKKTRKWGTAGAALGGLAASSLSKKGKISNSITGALVGGGLGIIAGKARGLEKAKKEGHDRDGITLKNSRRLDEIARKAKQDDDYESIAKRMKKDRETYEMAKEAREWATISALS